MVIALLALLLNTFNFSFGEELNLIMKLEVYNSAPNQSDYQQKENLFYFLVKTEKSPLDFSTKCKIPSRTLLLKCLKLVNSEKTCEFFN